MNVIERVNVPRVLGGSIAALVVLVWAFPQTRQSGPSTVGPLVWNDNSLIALQENGGNPGSPGDVKIEYYGHDAFKITSPAGLTILTDPWRNDPTGVYPKWFLTEFPAVRVDIIVSTHAHFDHDAVERPKGLVVLERLVGQFKLGDAEIRGLADKHQCDDTPHPSSDRSSTNPRDETCPPNNVMAFDNALQIITTGGLRIAVWGDNRAAPNPFLDQYLKDIDVLILPIDTVLARSDVEATVRKYDPKAIIPAHYFVDGLTTRTSGLASADSWVTDQEKAPHTDVRRLTRADLTLNPADLKGCHHRIYYFGNHFEKE